jgi:hypothetical protein
LVLPGEEGSTNTVTLEYCSRHRARREQVDAARIASASAAS